MITLEAERRNETGIRWNKDWLLLLDSFFSG
jgi:hypothetical protein